LSRPLASVFRISRAIHKYLGLILALYLLGMGVTGLLLNNPALISGVSVPWALTPTNYEPQNWNRMYLRQGVTHGDRWFLAGKPGVVYSQDNGRSFKLLDDGFPRAPYQRDTTRLLVRETPAGKELFAATRSGLYYRTGEQAWQRVELPGAGKRAVVDVVATSRHIVAVTHDGIYAAAVPGNAYGEVAISGTGRSRDFTGKTGIRDPSATLPDEREPDYRFTPIHTEVIDNERPSVPWFRIFHDIHNGNIIGPPGKWLLDLLAVGLIFLCISALVIWYVPWRKRRFKRRGRRLDRIFKFCWKYHLKIGIYSVAFVAVLAVTGAFLRPPLLIAVAPHFMDREHPLLALSPRGNAWGGKLQKALYASASETLLLAAEGGFFRGPADFSAPFRPFHLPTPVHGMGVTVLEEVEPGLILVGSFTGLYLWEEESGRVRRLPRPGLRGGHPYMSNDLISGVVMADGRPRFRVDYHDGLMPLFHLIPGHVPAMPAEIARATPMSLWHYLFEFHNGRIFEKWLGMWYMLIIPAVGAGLLLLAVTGIYDWFCRQKKPAGR
jgi:hypothetical protein